MDEEMLSSPYAMHRVGYFLRRVNLFTWNTSLRTVSTTQFENSQLKMYSAFFFGIHRN